MFEPISECGPLLLPILSSLWETAFPLYHCALQTIPLIPLSLSRSLHLSRLAYLPPFLYESDSSCRLPRHPFLHSTKGGKRKRDGMMGMGEQSIKERSKDKRNWGISSVCVCVCLYKYVFVFLCLWLCVLFMWEC